MSTTDPSDPSPGEPHPEFEALFSDMPPKDDGRGIPAVVGPGQPIPEPNPQPA